MEREKPQFEVRVNDKIFLPDGTTVEALPSKSAGKSKTYQLTVSPGSVSIHEAQHYTAARAVNISVSNVNIIPSVEARGTTSVSEFHPVVAAAPHALGSPGGGSDMWKVAISGHNETMVIEQAKALMAGKEEDVFIAASVIEQRRSISGAELDIAVDTIKRERRNPDTGVILVFKKPNGEVKTEKTKSEKGGVVIDLEKWHKKKESPKTQEPQAFAA